MRKIPFIFNNETIQAELPGGLTVLDFIRRQKRQMGTKIGCREGDCGACTVLAGELVGDTVHYRSMTSCLMPLANASGRHIVSIEGLNGDGLTPVQQALVDRGGTQCGFCTVGFVVSLSGFCLTAPVASPEQAVSAVDGNICRCTGYKSIERACVDIAKKLTAKDSQRPLAWLVQQGYVPEYFQTIPERLQQLQRTSQPAPEYSNSNGVAANAVFTGGGTDLYVQRPDEMSAAQLRPVFADPALRSVRLEGNRCRIAAACTVEDLRVVPSMREMFPRLETFIKLISSTPIRNMATLAGNFVNASPIGDMTVFFLALDADLTLQTGNNKREIALRKFFKAYKTLDLNAGETVAELHFPYKPQNTFFNFEKVSKRTHLDIASVNSALRLETDGINIQSAAVSAGGVAPIPLYLERTADFLVDRPLATATVIEASEIAAAEAAPISDVRGSADYKRLLLRQLVRAHFIELFPGKFALEELV